MLFKTIMSKKVHPLKRATLLIEIAELAINKFHYEEKENWEKCIEYRKMQIVKIKELKKLKQ